MRRLLPRSRHAEWAPPPDRGDPVAHLEVSNAGRVPELVPIRYGRMLRSPFTFLRGAAGLMARDLACLPRTGLKVQACGDCHLLNFGLFATPERHLVFDLNDFDETLPAPWEWDVKRLATSVVTAGRDEGLSESGCRAAAHACVRAYREHLRDYSRWSPLEVWYAQLTIEDLIELSPDAETHKVRTKLAEKARTRLGEALFPKLVCADQDRYRIVDQPPLLYHLVGDDLDARVRAGFEDYRLSLPDERRVLLDRYQLQDYVLKAVGIGSIGTHCMLLLLISEEDQPLFLQVKEARRSVLEPYTAPSAYDNQGQRIVVGQRLMQSSSDIFLGWVRGRLGYDFYVRQLRDMKFSVPLEGVSAAQLERYAGLCGQTLARAHAKSGDAATISGYLGKSDQFDDAISDFAVAYADQNEQDYAALVDAARTGRIEVRSEDDL